MFNCQDILGELPGNTTWVVLICEHIYILSLENLKMFFSWWQSKLELNTFQHASLLAFYIYSNKSIFEKNIPTSNPIFKYKHLKAALAFNQFTSHNKGNDYLSYFKYKWCHTLAYKITVKAGTTLVKEILYKRTAVMVWALAFCSLTLDRNFFLAYIMAFYHILHQPFFVFPRCFRNCLVFAGA